MRRTLLLTAILLLTIPQLFLRPAQTQQQECETGLPNLADYPPAGPTCKRKLKLQPWTGQPWIPNTSNPALYRCQLSVTVCGGVTKCYQSEGRRDGAGFCDDYSAMYDALLNREICCDPKCEPPTPWFGSSSACRDVQSPEINDSGGKMPLVTLYICGLDVFHDFPPKDYPGGVAQYKAGLASFVKQRVGSKVCCDKLREAVRTKKPCDPTDDIDCDGNRNTIDFTKLSEFPDINNLFTTPEGAPVDPIPRGLNPDDTEFFPPQDKCDCKWELTKGTLTCSPDGKQSHVYQARWRCPSTGNERFTRKEAPATTPCTPP